MSAEAAPRALPHAPAAALGARWRAMDGARSDESMAIKKMDCCRLFSSFGIGRIESQIGAGGAICSGFFGNKRRRNNNGHGPSVYPPSMSSVRPSRLSHSLVRSSGARLYVSIQRPLWDPARCSMLCVCVCKVETLSAHQGRLLRGLSGALSLQG